MVCKYPNFKYGLDYHKYLSDLSYEALWKCNWVSPFVKIIHYFAMLRYIQMIL